jgi:hypothetical protein
MIARSPKKGMRMSGRFFASLFCVSLLTGVFSLSAQPPSTVLALRPNGEAFNVVAKSIQHSLKTQYHYVERIVGARTTADMVDSIMSQTAPQLVLLMDNRAVQIFRTYQSRLPDSVQRIPSVALMGIALEDQTAAIKNSYCIPYELPISVSALSLQSTMNLPVKRIGVIYRKFMDRYIAAQRDSCAQKGIELVTYAIPNNGPNLDDAYRTTLLTMLDADNIDALWVPNDNRLLIKEGVLTKVLIPSRESIRIPVIVCLEKLVDLRITPLMFSLTPETRSIGMQSVDIIDEILSGNPKAARQRVFIPSVTRVCIAR